MSANTAGLTQALASSYMLVDLQIRSWSGKKTDREASTELLEAKQATMDGGQFSKNLLASANAELKLVQQAQSALRAFLYTKTLPWSSNSSGAKRGDRIIATGEAINFLVALKPYKQDCDNAVKNLQTVWPARVASAMRNLGMLADAGDYPDATEIPSLFEVTIDLQPIPAVSDFSRLNVPAELANQLADRCAQQAEVRFQNAMGDLRDRFIAELQRMATVLGKQARGEKTRLHDSLVTNLQGLVALAKSMDLGNNERFTELIGKVGHQLLRHPVSVYKVDTHRASEVASAAQQLATDAAMEEIWQ